MQRAVVAALLSAGESRIENPSLCDDAMNVLSACCLLGATAEERKDSQGNTYFVVKGTAHLNASKIHIGESGLGVRMLTPIVSLSKEKVIIEGAGSLLLRPMNFMKAPLTALGVAFESSENGCLPLTVSGTLQGGEIKLDGSLSSQFLTGLLMALPKAEQESTLHVENLKSKPYICMTIEVLRAFGVQVQADETLQTFRIRGKQKYQPARITIEGDWSSGAFLLVAGAIASREKGLLVKGLNPNSLQADKGILQALHDAGAMLNWDNEGVNVSAQNLRAFAIDATDSPDLFPPLACLAACCQGTSTLKGATRLIHKESNRAAALCQEFGNLGIRVAIEGDLMKVTGGEISGGKFFSHHDHRMAMAGAVMALRAESPVILLSPEVVSKSWAGFFEQYHSIREKQE